jgi:hypothetical protein
MGWSKATQMSNTYISLYIHYIFSIIQRLPLIVPEIQSRLWSYMGGVAKQNDMKALAVGGIPDHVHILLSLPATLSVATDLFHPLFPKLQLGKRCPRSSCFVSFSDVRNPPTRHVALVSY